jgi:endonuclease/exonuclease/phosphatase family metal-dependent hydrolase
MSPFCNQNYTQRVKKNKYTLHQSESNRGAGKIEKIRRLALMKIPGFSRRYKIVLVAILSLLLAGWLWWRTGAIDVILDNQALKELPAEGNTAEFTILTYNVQARPWFDDSKHKFQYLSPLLNQFDICAIQECFKDHLRLWKASKHPVKVYQATLKNPLKIVGSGLSILGKFPLVETVGTNFEAEGDFQNKLASKGVLLARFTLQGMPLDVYTTHIAAGKRPASLRARIEQGDEIIAFIKVQSPEDHSVILLGDFNMRPSRGAEDKAANANNPKVYGFDRIVSALALRDASDEINGPIGGEIDRVLFRPGKGYVMQPLFWQRDTPDFYDPEGKPLSDHKPVFVKFKLEREQAV